MKRIINCFLLVLVFSSVSLAQWSTDPNNPLRLTDYGYPLDVCTDGNGGFFALSEVLQPVNDVTILNNYKLSLKPRTLVI